MAQPSQTPRPTSDVDTQRSFDESQREIRDELLNSRGKVIEWWLTAVGIGMTAAAAFLTAIAVAAVVLGFFSFQRFSQIETEARQHMTDAKEYAEEAQRLVEEITAAHDEAQVRLAELNAEIVSNNPTEAARTVANIQADPTASLIDQAIAAAVLLQQQENFEEAIGKWRSIANVVGEEDRQLQARAWASIGYLLNDEELEAKIDAYTKAIELNPTYARAYHGRGAAKHDLDQYEAALVDLDRAIELNPTYARAYDGRGDIKRHLGLYKAAVADLDRAIELNPTRASAYLNRSNAKHDLDQYEAAVADLDRAIELNPTLYEAYHNRGHRKQNLGRTNEAREDYQKALDLAQGDGDEELVTRLRRDLSRLDNDEAP